MTNPQQILKQYFSYDSFKYPQQEMIESVLSGNDVVGVLPTGFGKSLCYQIPAIAFNGITLVISPLISLMKDQTDSLKSKGIKAEFLNSTLTLKKQREIENDCLNGNVKLLYLAPERLINEDRKSFFERLNVSLIAPDEAHLANVWGKNFRPGYRKLSLLRNLYPEVPIMAVTATATEEIIDDICEQLLLIKPKIFRASFDRPNISIEVTQKGYAEGKIRDLLNETFDYGQQGSAIIYCYSRKDCSDLSYFINNMTDHESAFYHAGMKKKERIETQEKFFSGEIKIIIATIAFGMGIDKPDVRLVVHHTMSKSIEGYYQEIGRAGRDGLPSRAVLLYSYHDIGKIEFLIKKTNQNSPWEKTQEELDRLEKMVEFCTRIQCRREMILNHFGENSSDYCGDNGSGCDVCGIK